MFNRLKASVILAPVIMLLLCWIGRLAGAEQVARMGIVPFILLAGAASIVMAYVITLYISFVAKTLFKK